jgi:Fe-S cluster biogenesis protein NfuA
MVEKELIEKVIELRIRPVLQAHGGDIEFQDYQDDIVWVNLTGACDGCPNALNTLKGTVEHFLKISFPEIKAVKDKNLEAFEEMLASQMAEREEEGCSGDCSSCGGSCKENGTENICSGTCASCGGGCSCSGEEE